MYSTVIIIEGDLEGRGGGGGGLCSLTKFKNGMKDDHGSLIQKFPFPESRK